MNSLKIRNELKKKKPHFVRQDQHKKKRLPDNWRRPRGSDSKMRVAIKGYKRSVEIGWGSPREAKGLSREGLVQILVHNISELENILPKTEGILIASDVGTRKKIEIANEASKKNITILNLKDPKKYVEEALAEFAKRKQDKIQKQKEEKKKDKKPGEKKPEEEKAEDTADPEEKKKKEKEERDKVLTKPQ